MAVIRKIIKKRVGPDGVEVDCEDDETPWIDIKETRLQKRERGKGLHYQKTLYHYGNNSVKRKFDEPPKITFKNPEDESQTIEYLKDKGENHGTTKLIIFETGRGRFFSRKRIHIDNSASNTQRKVREQRVENSDDPDVEDSEGNGDYIMVERIKLAYKESGKGAAFSRKKVHFGNEEADIRQMTGPCKEIQEE